MGERPAEEGLRASERPIWLPLVLTVALANASAAGDGTLFFEDGFEPADATAWSTAVGLDVGEVCYVPEFLDPPVPAWSGTCAADYLCCATCGLPDCHFECFDVEICPIAP